MFTMYTMVYYIITHVGLLTRNATPLFRARQPPPPPISGDTALYVYVYYFELI